MTKRKIAYISGTRADYGLMTPVLRAINKSDKLSLQVFVTGMHLMSQFGETFKIVEKEFSETEKIPATFELTKTSMADFAGKFLPQVIKTLNKYQPELVLTLGDRVEMLCVAMACLYLNIPSAQIHGGDKSGNIDDCVRHAITKLSHLHFPATKESAERIKKLGEEEWRIHVVGAPALDIILNASLPTKEELFKNLGIKDQRIILVTQHPVAEEHSKARQQMIETIEAVKKFDLEVVLIYPNTDSGSEDILEVIKKEESNSKFHIFPNLEYEDFLALEKYCSVWVGNSSGAMIESASFKTPVVNIGIRQKGRQHGENVINVGYNRGEIVQAIKKSLTDDMYLAKLSKAENPWGDGKAAKRIVEVLEEIQLGRKLLSKQITY